MAEKKDVSKKTKIQNTLQSVQNFLLVVGIVCLIVPLFVISLWPLLILAILLLFLGLLYFETVKESRAIIVERFGAFRKGLMSSKDKKFDEDWNIVPISANTNNPKIGLIDQSFDGFATKHLGGLRFVGWRWIDKSRKEFHLRRRSFEIASDGKRKIVSHDETSTDGLYLQWDIYPIIVEKAETIEKERFTPTIILAVPMAVRNIYVTVYVGDPNWPENVETVLSGIVRSWTARKTIEDVISQKGKQGLLNEILGTEPDSGPNNKAFKAIGDSWGIEVDKEGLQIIDVELPPDEQEAIAKAKKEQYKALGVAQQTSGALLAIRSDATGKKIEDIRAELNGNPEKLAEHEKNSKELLLQRVSADAGSLLHIKTEGSSGSGSDLLAITAAAGQVLNRTMSSGEKKKKIVVSTKEKNDEDNEEDEKKKKKRQDTTLEESKKEFDIRRNK